MAIAVSAGQNQPTDLRAPLGWIGRGFSAPGDVNPVPAGRLRFLADEAAALITAASPTAERRLTDVTKVAKALGMGPQVMDPPRPDKRTVPNRIMALREGEVTAYFTTFVPEDRPNPEVNGVLHLCRKAGDDCAKSHIGRFPLDALASNLRLAIELSPRIFQ